MIESITIAAWVACGIYAIVDFVNSDRKEPVRFAQLWAIIAFGPALALAVALSRFHKKGIP
jgi:hypothetical protein